MYPQLYHISLCLCHSLLPSFFFLNLCPPTLYSQQHSLNHFLKMKLDHASPFSKPLAVPISVHVKSQWLPRLPEVAPYPSDLSTYTSLLHSVLTKPPASRILSEPCETLSLHTLSEQLYANSLNFIQGFVLVFSTASTLPTVQYYKLFALVILQISLSLTVLFFFSTVLNTF